MVSYLTSTLPTRSRRSEG